MSPLATPWPRCLRPRLGTTDDRVNNDRTISGTDSGEDYDPSRWIVIAAASAVLFVGVGFTNAFGIFVDYYQTKLLPEVPADQIILIGSVAASLYFTLGAFTGRFADVVGYRIALVLGGALMVGSMFAASVSVEFFQLFLSQGLMFGLGLAFVYPPATTISRQYFGKRHGMANGIVVSGGALGGCVLPYSVKSLIIIYGLPQTFRILGYLAVGILIPSIALLRPKHNRSSPTGRRLMEFSLLANPRFLALLITCTIAMTGFLPRYFLITTSAIAKGVGPDYASWLLGLMNGLSIVGRVGIGYVADRYGKVHALSASFVLCGLGHFAFWLPGVTLSHGDRGSVTALFTLFVVYIGVFGSGFISLFPVVVADLFGASALASKTGLLNTAIGIGVLAGPSAVYAIVGDGLHRRWTLGILTAGLFLFIGGFLIAFSVAGRKEEHQPEDNA